jgi:ABC-type uncharacterized transport system permease subunit
MGFVKINRHPTIRQLHQFGLIWLGFLTFFGVIAWFRLESRPTAVALWSLAAAVPIIGWLVPPFMRLVFLGMSYAAWPIGFVVSHVVLAAVYYLVLTPIGLVMRLFGYDPMARRRTAAGATFWMKRTMDDRGPQRYFRQF